MGAASRRRPGARRRGARTRARRAISGCSAASCCFNDGWVPYEERGAWLLQADCAVSTHRDHLETRFALPHAAARLLLGRAAGRLHARRRARRAGRARRPRRRRPARRRRTRSPPRSPRARPRPRRIRRRAAAAAAELRWSAWRAPRPPRRGAGPSAPLGLRAGRARPRSPALRPRRGLHRRSHGAQRRRAPGLAARPLAARITLDITASSARGSRVRRRTSRRPRSVSGSCRSAAAPAAQHCTPRAVRERPGQRVDLIAEDERRPGEQPRGGERLQRRARACCARSARSRGRPCGRLVAPPRW